MKEGLSRDLMDLPSWQFLQRGLDRRRARKAFKRRLNKARRQGGKRMLAEDPETVERATPDVRSDPWYWDDLMDEANVLESRGWSESAIYGYEEAWDARDHVRRLLADLAYFTGRLATLPRGLEEDFVHATRGVLFTLHRLVRP